MPINVVFGANDSGHQFLHNRMSQNAQLDQRQREMRQQAAMEAARLNMQAAQEAARLRLAAQESARADQLKWAALNLDQQRQQQAYEMNYIDALQRQQQINFGQQYQSRGQDLDQQQMQMRAQQADLERQHQSQMQENMFNQKWQSSAVEQLENEVAIRRQMAKNMPLDWEGQQLYGELAGKLRGIQAQRGQLRPEQYAKVLSQWTQEYDNARLETFAQKEQTVDDVIRTRVKDLGNGYAIISQPDGKVEVREIAPQMNKTTGSGPSSGGQDAKYTPEQQRQIEALKSGRQESTLSQAFNEPEEPPQETPQNQSRKTVYDPRVGSMPSGGFLTPEFWTEGQTQAEKDYREKSWREMTPEEIAKKQAEKDALEMAIRRSIEQANQSGTMKPQLIGDTVSRQQEPQIPVPKTQEEYDRLPPGTIYIGPDGMPRTKR